jgi:protein involved in polysaccharide export with SLBB domain
VLHPGDSIQVKVAGHREFSGTWRVDEDGMLDIPYGGAFGIEDFAPGDFSREIGRVSGIKPAELAARIARGLNEYVVKKPPQVTVKFAGRRGR